jgi:processive 1,2-diacylglycerol beta-glucosyltransferase
MATKKKILLISAPIGSGHIRSAEALAQAMQAKYKNADPVICNVFDFFSPAIGKIILNSYLKILGFFPEVYKKMYGLGNESAWILKLRECLSSYLSKRMQKFILNHDPALVVCTHATPAGLVAYLKKEGKLKAPIAAVITDYVVHRLWVYDEFDHYFVATAEMARYLEEKGIAANKIAVTGIPVTPEFSQPVMKAEVCAKTGLDPNKPILLIMGGGAGLLPMGKIIGSLSNTDLFAALDLQIIAVAGKNQLLYEEVAALAKKIPHTLKCFAYADNVHELMAIADILISKPGGMTCAEALSRELPLFIYRPLPGQEEANTRYLTKEGAAYLVNSHAQLFAALAQIFAKDPDKLAEMRTKAQNLSRPEAAFAILESLGKYIEV